MNQELKILFKKGSLFILPIITWIIIVLTVDPFNYFNFSKAISQPSKEKSAQKLNSLLYNSVHFRNHPTPNVIIGDSRIRKLPVDRIKEITGDDYFTLHSNAAKLNEIIDLFWLTDSLYCISEFANLKNVLIGINFNLYNAFAYNDGVADVKEILHNPFIYIFNWNIVETIYLALKHEWFAIEQNEKKDRDLFWDYTIKTIAKNHYSKWKHPKETLFRLEEMGAYCKANNINLTLLIVPHQKEFHKRLIEFKLTNEELRFKQEIMNIGRVIDFDYPNSITDSRSCFSDPIHTTDSISELIIRELFADSLTIGKLLQ